jgi:hypothetical protein
MESRRSHGDSRQPRRSKPKKSGTKAIFIAASVGGAVVVGFVAVVLVMQMSKSRRSDPRLFGTWQSDADATIADMKKGRPITDQGEQGLRRVFGKAKITYTADTMTTDFEGKVESQSYEVVAKDADAVTIKAWSPVSKKDESFRITFVGNNTYWVDVPSGKARECFRRVN